MDKVLLFSCRLWLCNDSCHNRPLQNTFFFSCFYLFLFHYIRPYHVVISSLIIKKQVLPYVQKHDILHSRTKSFVMVFPNHLSFAGDLFASSMLIASILILKNMYRGNQQVSWRSDKPEFIQVINFLCPLFLFLKICIEGQRK